MKIKDLDSIRDNVAKDDRIIKQRPDDTRKAKLTLRHLNKLRKMRELSYLEKLYQDEQLSVIFGNEDETETI